MKIELRELMDGNEMMSHIFLDCIPHDKLREIKDIFVGDKDWINESVKIPVEMKIGGVSVNPKHFFNMWKDQIERIILEKAKEVVSTQIGSKKIIEIQNKMTKIEQVMESWEEEINWNVVNPFINR